ncbi:SDR family NAD(P)-dependent oxidoreductase [Cryobacterium algoritolerans]|uniref:SDR family NAD(P)-dependent oxidoreductase n=1 Tax=Cryobacterium algoritolerans TaxID=1259184 RepID=UPI003B9719FC
MSDLRLKGQLRTCSRRKTTSANSPGYATSTHSLPVGSTGLRSAGWPVLLTYQHDEQAAVKFVETIQTVGGLASFIRVDMAKEHCIAAIFEAADKLGTLTPFVANAGVAASQSRVDELTDSRIVEMDRLLSRKAPHRCTSG